MSEHKHDHQCPECKAEYDCYIRDEYNECPMAYFTLCDKCIFKHVISDPRPYRYHPIKIIKVNEVKGWEGLVRVRQNLRADK